MRYQGISTLSSKLVEAEKSSIDNPIEEMGLTVQHVGGQLCIIPPRHVHSNHSGNSGEWIGAVMEDNAAVAVANDKGEMMLARAGPHQRCSTSLDLFSQQCLYQQLVEDLLQEILTSFRDQCCHIQSVLSAVKWIAIQPIICSGAAILQMVEAQVCILSFEFFICYTDKDHHWFSSNCISGNCWWYRTIFQVCSYCQHDTICIQAVKEPKEFVNTVERVWVWNWWWESC